MQALEMQHPGLVEAVASCLLTIDIEAPTRDGLAELTKRLTRSGPAWSPSCWTTSPRHTALYLHRTIDDPTVPVVVRTRGDADWARRSTWTTRRATTLPGPAAVPMLDRTCSPDLVDGGVREQLARALYEDHLVRAAARGCWTRRGQRSPTTSGRRLVRPPTAHRRAGGERLRAAAAPPLGEPTIAFTPEETRRLAERDHDRWRAWRGSDGWRYGTVRDACAKVTPQAGPVGRPAAGVARVQPHPGRGDPLDPRPHRVRGGPAPSARPCGYGRPDGPHIRPGSGSTATWPRGCPTTRTTSPRCSAPTSPTATTPTTSRSSAATRWSRPGSARARPTQRRRDDPGTYDAEYPWRPSTGTLSWRPAPRPTGTRPGDRSCRPTTTASSCASTARSGAGLHRVLPPAALSRRT